MSVFQYYYYYYYSLLSFIFFFFFFFHLLFIIYYYHCGARRLLPQQKRKQERKQELIEEHLCYVVSLMLGSMCNIRVQICSVWNVRALGCVQIWVAIPNCHYLYSMTVKRQVRVRTQITLQTLRPRYLTLQFNFLLLLSHHWWGQAEIFLLLVSKTFHNCQ